MRRIALVVMALAVATFVAPGVAAAATSPVSPDDLGLVASAGSSLDSESGAIRVAVQPGGGVWQSATISNRGRVRFTVEVRGDGDHGDWVRPAAETLLLEPGTSTTVDFTVAPPSDAEREDAHAQLVVSVVEAPDVTRSLDLVVSVLGPAVVEAPVAEPAPSDTHATAEPAASAPAAVSGGRSTGETLVFVVIFAALVALVAWTVIPPLRSLVDARRKRRERRALARPPLPQPVTRAVEDRTHAARAKATANRAPARVRAVNFVDPLDLAVAEALAEPAPAATGRLRRKALDVDALNRALNS